MLNTIFKNIVSSAKNKFGKITNKSIGSPLIIGILAILMFASYTKAQEYKIHISDIVGNVDSALVTFGDSTKYTDKEGNVTFYNPLVGIQNKPTLPEEFEVSQPYASPVTDDDINVDIEVEHETKAKFEVYNSNGELISSDESEIMQGNHSLKIEGISGLAGGVYFIRVGDENTSCVRKFINLNSGSSGELRFKISNGGHQFLLPKSTVNSYIKLHVEKEGYVSHDEQVDPSQTFVDVDFEREGKTLSGIVFDNDTWEKTPSNIVIYYDNNAIGLTTDGTGFFDVQLPRETNMLDSVKAWNDSSYIMTYKNIPIETDITNAGLFITTYKNLNVSSGLFFDFVMEVATREQSSADGEEHIVSIDFRNASRDYTYWIDKDDAYTHVDSTAYDTLSDEEQQHIADVITERFYSHMQDTTHMPKFYFAEAGEKPPLLNGIPPINPTDGTIFVTHLLGGNGYGYAAKNYEDDYLLNASIVYIGDPTNNDGFIIQEAASFISSRKGSLIEEIGGQSVFSEVNPTPYMMGIDIKLLHIEENIFHNLNDPNITPIQEYTMPSGITIKRFYYPTGVRVNDVLGKH